MGQKPGCDRDCRVFADIERVRFVFATQVTGGALEGDFFNVIVAIKNNQQWRDQQLQGLQAGAVDQAAMAGQRLNLSVALGGNANGGRGTVAGGKNGQWQILHIAVLANQVEQIKQALSQARHVLRRVNELGFLASEQFHGEYRKIPRDKICRNDAVDRSMVRAGQ